MAVNNQASFITRCWYEKSPLLYLLLPLAGVFWLLSSARRYLYQKNLLSRYTSILPVVVVGNITVGGTGKTPLVIALIEALRQSGFSPGVISRGYGSKAPHYPFCVSSDSTPLESGDEPLLIAQRTGVPVVIDASRTEAAKYIEQNTDCDVIITDDGLQHYALQRDIELMVIDASRTFGNRLLLPAGPLRETVSRTSSVDFIISNGDGVTLPSLPEAANATPHYSMQLQVGELVDLGSQERQASEKWPLSRKVHAIAGIGNPQRFFDTLRAQGFETIEHRFDDHYNFNNDDLSFDDDLPIIMTEKDAIKVAHLQPSNRCWYLPVDAVIAPAFFASLVSQLKSHTANNH